ncbi:hypothetical protein ACFP3I_11605 [Chryseobacterium arachidis]
MTKSRLLRLAKTIKVPTIEYEKIISFFNGFFGELAPKISMLK